jgi:hypothetical protein
MPEEAMALMGGDKVRSLESSLIGLGHMRVAAFLPIRRSDRERQDRTGQKENHAIVKYK